MLKGCWSLISGFLALIGLFFILKDCGFFNPPPPIPPKKPEIESKVVPPIVPMPNTSIESEHNLSAFTAPKYKVTARSGFTINLLVSENTTKDQLKALIYTFREARIHKSFAKLIPLTIKPWYNGEYSRIFIQVFNEPQWATELKLKIVLGKTQGREDIWKFNSEYNRHIKAEYVYETARDNRWSEYGCIGFSELSFRSADYEELFSKPMYP